MLIDAFVPEFDANEIHRIAVSASRERVYSALWTADLGESLVIKLLLGLRSLPGWFRRRSSPRNQKITLQTLIDSGFGILADSPADEIVLGVTGRFWRPTGNVSGFNRADFEHPVAWGFARGVWSFSVREGRQGQTILQTETRVTCGDAASRRKFLIYWGLIRPFSGLIRQIMLRKIRKVAESRD